MRYRHLHKTASTCAAARRRINDTESPLDRRDFLKSASVAAGLCLSGDLRLLHAEGTTASSGSSVPFRVATFRCDVTPPLGEPMICCDAIKTVESPLLAKGIVLDADGQRYVLCAVDWCELCNGAYDSMRSRIAEAAGTKASQVALHTVHQHTAPVVDIAAQKLLAEIGMAKGVHLAPKAYDTIEQSLAATVKQSLAKFEPFDQIGVGQAKVDRVASSRRPRDAAGRLHSRMSACTDPAVIALPEGTIDPYLKTITLACSGKPLARLHYYATHPQSSYGDGRASSDIVGDAREALEHKEGVFQIYFTGCAGDIALGKYNDASNKARKELAARLLAGMEASVAVTRVRPVGAIQWRTYSLTLPPRDDAGFTMAECCDRMNGGNLIARLGHGAVRVAFMRRNQEPIKLTSLQIGDIHILHLPGEPLIEFQRFAQAIRPTEFVAVAGYGDCATGYICPASARPEGGYEPTATNVKPESEVLLKQAIVSLLGVK
jgi:hypothetical protein